MVRSNANATPSRPDKEFLQATHSDSVATRYRESASLATLVHGIFAITMTLLILDLRLPNVVATHQMGSAIRDLTPRAVAYSFAFAYLAGSWMNVRSYFRVFDTIDAVSTALMLAFVGVLSLTPIATAAIATAHNDDANLGVAVRVASCLILLADAVDHALATWEKRNGRMPAHVRTRRRKQFAFTFGPPTTALAVSFASPWTAVVILAADIASTPHLTAVALRNFATARRPRARPPVVLPQQDRDARTP